MHDVNSFMHTCWNTKYHIAFALNVRRRKGRLAVHAKENNPELFSIPRTSLSFTDKNVCLWNISFAYNSIWFV